MRALQEAGVVDPGATKSGAVDPALASACALNPQLSSQLCSALVAAAQRPAFVPASASHLPAHPEASSTLSPRVLSVAAAHSRAWLAAAAASGYAAPAVNFRAY